MATVLLATDGSDRALASLKRGIGIIGVDHAFRLLTVVPPAFIPSATVGPMDSHPLVLDPTVEEEVQRSERATAVAGLEGLANALGIEGEALVEVGEPGPTICSVAGRDAVDVIVIGSHGHGWLQRVLIGSVSKHVLQHAPCPVLVVRDEDQTRS
jgi:nucleotide-binding universal stress UspA family protein